SAACGPVRGRVPGTLPAPPVRLPAAAAPRTPIRAAAGRGLGRARRALAASARAARRTRQALSNRAPHPRRLPGVGPAGARPARTRRLEAALAAGPDRVQPAEPASLRGPQLDGLLDGVAPALPRPGAGGVDPAAPRDGDRRRRLEPGHPSRGPARRAAGEDPYPPLEGRIHHPRVPLAPGRAGLGAGPAPFARLLRAPLLGRTRPGGRIRPGLRRPARGTPLRLAGAEHRSLAPGLLQPGRRGA